MINSTFLHGCAYKWLIQAPTLHFYLPRLDRQIAVCLRRGGERQFRTRGTNSKWLLSMGVRSVTTRCVFGPFLTGQSMWQPIYSFIFLKEKESAQFWAGICRGLRVATATLSGNSGITRKYNSVAWSDKLLHKQSPYWKWNYATFKLLNFKI